MDIKHHKTVSQICSKCSNYHHYSPTRKTRIWAQMGGVTRARRRLPFCILLPKHPKCDKGRCIVLQVFSSRCEFWWFPYRNCGELRYIFFCVTPGRYCWSVDGGFKAAIVNSLRMAMILIPLKQELQLLGDGCCPSLNPWRGSQLWDPVWSSPKGRTGLSSWFYYCNRLMSGFPSTSLFLF